MNKLKKNLAIITALILLCTGNIALAELDEWLCPDCGSANNTNFCTQCGAKKPEEIVCTGCGTKYAIDSGAIFCGNCGTKLQQNPVKTIKYEGDGFNTPEEALTYYMEGIKNLNFEQMLGAFAWETQIEHCSLQEYFERGMLYTTTTKPRMPAINDFMFSANVNILRSNEADMIYRSIENYILGEDSPIHSATGSIHFQKDTDELSNFFNKFNNGKLDKLTKMANIRFMSPDEITNGKFTAGRNPEIFISRHAWYHADEIVNLVGIADIEDETILCIPTIGRYGDKWYIISLYSMTSGMIGISYDYLAFACGKGIVEDIRKK